MLKVTRLLNPALKPALLDEELSFDYLRQRLDIEDVSDFALSLVVGKARKVVRRYCANIPAATLSVDEEAVARQIYDALAANDDINLWHKDRLLPMITQIIVSALAANRSAAIEAVKAKRAEWKADKWTTQLEQS